MRKRNTMALTKPPAQSSGLRVGVVAACLLSLVSAAQAQSASDPTATDELYGLRGTTSASETSRANSASTLYGALPAPTDRSGTAPTTEAQDETDSNSASPQAAIIASPAEAEPGDLTGAIGSPSDQSQADLDYAASLRRQNDRVGTVDGLPLNTDRDDTLVPGFMLGTLTLRPTLSQRIVREEVSDGARRTNRTYSETTLTGTLQSDWSRHQLSVDGFATYQKNISGTGEEQPSVNVDARLDLDLVNDVTAMLGAGYSYSQESRTDPNAIAGAATQSGIHEARASIGLRKELGLLRGTTSLEVTRRMYGDATLANGNSIVVNDRDTLGAELTTRIGYAVSPALIPFLEISAGRENYDQRIDSTGAERSSTTYAARAGTEINLGEKLRGELAAGYLTRSLDDASLSDISGLTLDGELNWSPRRGTDVMVGLGTTVESATTAGESGAVVYELASNLSQQIHSSVVARLGATTALRDYDSGSGRNNQRSYGISTGLTWSVNRYLDVVADASYTRIKEQGVTDEKTTRLGLGIKLRR